MTTVIETTVSGLVRDTICVPIHTWFRYQFLFPGHYAGESS